MTDNTLVSAELDKVDASASAIRSLYGSEPVPSGVGQIEQGSAQVRSTLVEPPPDEPHFDMVPDFREIGATVLSGDAVHDGEDYDHLILSAGHHVFRGQNRAQTIIVEHGATLELQDGTLIGKDAPLLPVEFDPKQFSNGLIVIGQLIANGNLVSPEWDQPARLIKIESENPNGVRWHVIAMHRAFVDISGVEFSHLGRTTVDPLDSVNLIGRYSLHFHGVYGPRDNPLPYQFRVRNCSLHHGKKWLCALHNTSDGEFTDNLLQYADGSGLVLEEGNESRNIITGNRIGNITGNGLTPDKRGGASTVGVDFGFEGTGFWARSLVGGNEIDVEVKDCRFGAVVMAQHISKQRYVHLSNFPGANTAVTGEYTEVSPRDGRSCTPAKINASGCADGLETWNFDTDPVRIIKEGSSFQASDVGILTFFTAHLPCSNITVEAPIGFLHQSRKLPSGSYSGFVSATDSLFKANTGFGLFLKNGATFTRTRFEGDTAISLAWRIDYQHDLIIDNCEWTGRLLNPDPIPWSRMLISPELNIAFCPVRIFVKTSSGNYRLYVPEQAPDYVPPASGSPVQYLWGSPQPGATNQELADEFGLSTLCYLTPEDAVWSDEFGAQASPVSYDELPPIPELTLANTLTSRSGDVLKIGRVNLNVPAEPLLALLIHDSGSYEYRKMTGPVQANHVLEFAGTAAKTQATVWFRSADGAVGICNLLKA